MSERWNGFSVTSLDGRIRICLESPTAAFTFEVDADKLKSPSVRELVNAWAVGIATIPGSGVGISIVESMLDWLDENHPVKRYGLWRSVLKLW